MAKRKAVSRKKSGKTTAKRPASRRSAKRPSPKRPVKRQASAKKKAPAKKASKNAPSKVVAKKKAVSRPKPTVAAGAKRPAAPVGKVPRLDRARRVLDEHETHDTPPSSLDMTQQRGSAARSGRAGMEHGQRDHLGMGGVTGGDPDVNVEDAYFAGEEAPGGDNPTPDQDIVDDIGKALGVTYEDSEELKGADKVEERDKHRWELDPASSDDYKDRS
jgi:hypothetical protein